MEIAPILRSLWKQRIIASLLVLELAVTFACVSNIAALIPQRFAALRAPSGIKETGLLVATPNSVSTFSTPSIEDIQKAEAALRTEADIQSAGIVNQVPYVGTDTWKGTVSRISADKDEREVSIYAADAMGMETLGLAMTRGRTFLDVEFSSFASPSAALSGTHVAIITEKLATKLFPAGDGIGNTIALGGQPMKIVGLMRYLARPAYMGEAANEDCVLLPVIVKNSGNHLLLARVSGAVSETGSWKTALETKLENLGQNRLRWEVRDYASIREKHFASDHAALIVMSGIVAALIVVTGCGISGFSGFWMRRRIPQIAIRRALGATRWQILEYFLTENLILSVMGCALGFLFALAIDLILFFEFGIQIQAVWGFSFGAVVILALCQLAALAAMLRAASVSPALATRM